ncbi:MULTISPECIES: glycoside hydrolase domain-containing protein [unclassified Streptomyces]|uniref:glycoside hydrolase domain-containing protein n=1 Tax=unclassified Streptomyces TaxID=2593676 RepID=UPI0033E7F7F7
MARHRPSKNHRTIAMALGGAALLVGGALTAEAASGSGSASGSGAAAVAGPARPVSLSKPATYTGRAFDTCTAPTLAQMKAWKTASPYGGAAVYIGGRNRGCAQPQLTPDWVKAVSAVGWKLIPLYVGAQPPCKSGSNPERMTASTAASLGATDGADAGAKATALGMRPGSPVYLDMEGFDTANTSCKDTVLTYTRAWNKALHAKGYRTGYYGFASSSAAAVAASTPGTDMPDAIWYAAYDDVESTTTGYPFGTKWAGHRRGHQYAINKKETYGGVTLTVDRDAWDAPVAVVAK